MPTHSTYWLVAENNKLITALRGRLILRKKERRGIDQLIPVQGVFCIVGGGGGTILLYLDYGVYTL